MTVKKARIKFSIFTILGIILFFSFVFGMVHLVLKKIVERDIVNELTEIETYYSNTELPYSQDYFVCEITYYNSPTEFSYSEIVSVGFTNKEIDDIVNSAVKRN